MNLLIIKSFISTIFLYPIIKCLSRIMGPKKMWNLLIKESKKSLNDEQIDIIVSTSLKTLKRISSDKSCIIESTILAILLNSNNKIMLKLGYKNRKYYLFQMIFTGNRLTERNTDYHCWLTINDKPIILPFVEDFWTVIYTFTV